MGADEAAHAVGDDDYCSRTRITTVKGLPTMIFVATKLRTGVAVQARHVSSNCPVYQRTLMRSGPNSRRSYSHLSVTNRFSGVEWPRFSGD